MHRFVKESTEKKISTTINTSPILEFNKEITSDGGTFWFEFCIIKPQFARPFNIYNADCAIICMSLLKSSPRFNVEVDEQLEIYRDTSSEWSTSIPLVLIGTQKDARNGNSITTDQFHRLAREKGFVAAFETSSKKWEDGNVDRAF